MKARLSFDATRFSPSLRLIPLDTESTTLATTTNKFRFAGKAEGHQQPVPGPSRSHQPAPARPPVPPPRTTTTASTRPTPPSPDKGKGKDINTEFRGTVSSIPAHVGHSPGSSRGERRGRELAAFVQSSRIRHADTRYTFTLVLQEHSSFHQQINRIVLHHYPTCEGRVEHPSTHPSRLAKAPPSRAPNSRSAAQHHGKPLQSPISHPCRIARLFAPPFLSPPCPISVALENQHRPARPRWSPANVQQQQQQQKQRKARTRRNVESKRKWTSWRTM